MCVCVCVCARARVCMCMHVCEAITSILQPFQCNTRLKSLQIHLQAQVCDYSSTLLDYGEHILGLPLIAEGHHHLGWLSFQPSVCVCVYMCASLSLTHSTN